MLNGHQPPFSRIRQSPAYIPCLIFIFFWGLYSLTARGLITEADGIVNFMSTRALVENGSAAIPCDFPQVFISPGQDGKCYSKYGIGLPLLSMPFYGMGRLLAGAASADANEISGAKLAVSMFNQLATAVTCAAVYVLAFKISGHKRRAVELAFMFGLFTLAWPYASTYFSQPVVGLLLLLAVIWLNNATPGYAQLFLAGTALGVSLLVRLDSAPLILIIVLWATFRTYTRTNGFKEMVPPLAMLALPLITAVLLLTLIQLIKSKK